MRIVGLRNPHNDYLLLSSCTAHLESTPGVHLNTSINAIHSCSCWLWGLKSYLPLESLGLIIELLKHHSLAPYLEKTEPYPIWPLQLLTALRTITILCAVRDLLLSYAVFICFPVSPWASTDPGLKAAAAQDLPTRN